MEKVDIYNVRRDKWLVSALFLGCLYLLQTESRGETRFLILNILLSFGLTLVVFILWVETFQPEYRAMRELRWEKEAKEKEAREARMAKQMEKFRKQRLSVYIREKDGRKSAFESVLIKVLLTYGVTVEPLSEKDGRAIASGETSALKDGVLVLIGTSWSKNGTSEAYDLDGGGSLGEYEWERTYCDYRLLATDTNSAGKIIGAGCYDSNSSYENELANNIVKDLARSTPVQVV